MLELKEIKKVYKTASDRVVALKDINLKFRESEFVSILGQSGCGKTTLLNIIGGLDRYTSGDLIINGKSTKRFKDRDWDAYRNYKVGFIFQSYNLIGHQTVLSNVELALTIGGINKAERKERAIKALEEVGLKDQIYKKPNQLSGGQMQRVAIARALVNNPDIILADEPTGALDTKTSIQVMEILKKISENKLIIMVTHNPELAEKYSSRIIKILDGEITEDSNPISDNEQYAKKNTNNIGRTSMSLFTAFRLSLNNLLTKKARTILVALAGSIGIIGIALIQSLSNGLQAYIDQIQEETLTSYPLTIMQETSDLAGTLLAMRPDSKSTEKEDSLKEEQYISKMLDNISTNDLKNFKSYLEDNKERVNKDVLTVKYGYSVDPLIYGIDETKEPVKLNPSNLFESSFSGMGLMSTYSSVYNQMIDDRESLADSYDVIAGRFPEKYDEMIIVLSDRNSISDLLMYSLGFRKTDELKGLISKIMNGEKVEINNSPLEVSYDDLMNKEFKLILPTDLYKYNEKYDIYEDMSKDKEYMQNIYDEAINLKIVGIVTNKEGSQSLALNPGVSYTSDLVEYIIDQTKDKEMVKKQLENTEIDVLTGKRFDDTSDKLGLDFKDLISVDSNMLKSAFNIKIDQKEMEEETQKYLMDMSKSIDIDTKPAKEDFENNLKILSKGLLSNVDENISEDNIETVIENYLNEYEPSKIINEMETKYSVQKGIFKQTYSGLLKGLLQIYVKINDITKKIPNTIKTEEEKQQIEKAKEELIQKLPKEIQELINKVKQDTNNFDIKSMLVDIYTSSSITNQTANALASIMTESVIRKEVITKVGNLTTGLSNQIASTFNVDQSKIASAFKVNMTDDEISRLVSTMLGEKETNAKTNLINFGYQDKEEPTYISFYFKSFDGKEDFLKFIGEYNNELIEKGEKEKEINYTDTTGILMSSVKTIVNGVTNILIAFVSISLVVSSIMIGIITYISVYERTKEIGILRAIGASKRNISSIFNAETFIIGLLSGIIGIGITYSLLPLVNMFIHKLSEDTPITAVLYPHNTIILIALSIILTLIGGLIPARAASKKDPVIALRTE